jgi:hypothetical protein
MLAEAAEDADMGRLVEGDMAGLDCAGLANADMSTRARPVPAIGRDAVGVVVLEREGEE